MNYSGAPGLEIGGGSILDPAVMANLPAGSKVLSTEGHGVSFWANTGRIDVEIPLPDRAGEFEDKCFFIKVLSGETGKNMVKAEYESMKAIHSVSPDFAPNPIAYGEYEILPGTFFFLCEFRDLLDELPEPDEFTGRLAALHQNSKSPTGNFGFHTPTYPGNLPQFVEWEDSWEVFFAKSLRQALDFEIKAKGRDDEMEALLPAIFDRVIPRLLRPLETDGRSVKPSLVHGDLWYANSGIDAESGGSLIFDACCFYAHNEYEFGQWKPACNRFDDKYLEAYHQRVNRSAPEEDYDGRLDLYKLRFNVHVSALFFDNQTLRKQVLGDIRDLVIRYGGGGEREELGQTQ
ncbi:protein-ribulosamine 3-kinase, chloroplastic [Rhypophila decipiens]|uniref:protein-ribulosamine 3-kinase n=1 Tax=Rhypophila decipiens TaxID=261697 RepID=A0AAN6XY13_9PEZI|nr:protein-ribulosamine 3-kinase, chloroplastic [Rhypophila decipiens]